MAYTHAQQVALAVVPKFSAGLSILGSSWIIHEVVRDRKKLSLVYHRLMLALSCLDVLVSSAWWLSTWPVPADIEGLYGNVGNDATCNAQGFFIQLKSGFPFYNSFLALYYCAVIGFGWTESRLRKIEPLLHFIALSVAVGTATASAVLGLFGSANLWCWIAGKYSLYRMLFFYIWYWISFVVVTVSMLLVVGTVSRLERASRRYSISKNKSIAKKVATQAVLYISAFLLTALFATIVRVWQAFSTTVPFWPVLCMTIFYPAQGFFNAIIYTRPRYLRYRQKHPEWSLGATILATLRLAIRTTTITFSMQGSTAQPHNSSHHDDDDDYKLGTPLEEEIGEGSTSADNDHLQEHQPSDDLGSATEVLGAPEGGVASA